MAFTVHFSGDGNDGHRDYGDAASYSFNDAGLLVVLDGEGQQITYSAAWHLVEQAVAPPPNTTAVPFRIR